MRNNARYECAQRIVRFGCYLGINLVLLRIHRVFDILFRTPYECIWFSTGSAENNMISYSIHITCRQKYKFILICWHDVHKTACMFFSRHNLQKTILMHMDFDIICIQPRFFCFWYYLPNNHMNTYGFWLNLQKTIWICLFWHGLQKHIQVHIVFDISCRKPYELFCRHDLQKTRWNHVDVDTCRTPYDLFVCLYVFMWKCV